MVRIKYITILLLNIVTTNGIKAQQNNQEQINGLFLQSFDKAKKEHKLIMIDCFATWCLPCKKMDSLIQNNDSVKNLLNENYIVIKLQLDTTERDNNETKSTRQAANFVKRKYKIHSLPTFLFLSPEGVLLNKTTGFMNSTNFINIAKSAFKLKKFEDPYDLYEESKNRYDSGEKDYEKMLSFIDMAKRFRDKERLSILIIDYTHYLANSNDDKLYAKENSIFLKKYILPDTPIFERILTKSEKNERHSQHAKFIADEVIQSKFVSKITKVTNGMRKKNVDMLEFNWKQLLDTLKTHFSTQASLRNLIAAKVSWYFYNNNAKQLAKALCKLIKIRDIDTLDPYEDIKLNMYCWAIFNNVSDVQQLAYLTMKMRDLVRRNPTDYLAIDTYANLLYKIGERKNAIVWQTTALNIITKNKEAKDDQEKFQERLAKMKTGIPTWTPGVYL